MKAAILKNKLNVRLDRLLFVIFAKETVKYSNSVKTSTFNTCHFQRFEITNIWVEKSNILEVKFDENFEP